MRGVRPSIVVAVVVFGCPDVPIPVRPSIDASEIRPQSERCLARDDKGIFVWVEEDSPFGVSLPKIDADRVRLSRGDGAMLAFTEVSTAALERTSLQLDDPDRLLDDDRLDVVVDGTRVTSIRFRRLPNATRDAVGSFWRLGTEAGELRKTDAVAAAEKWIAVATSTGAAEAQGEAARRLRAAAFVLIHDGQFSRVPPLLEQALVLSSSVADRLGAARNAYYRGQLSYRAGAYLGAVRALDDALEQARALDATSDVVTYVTQKAVALADAGRYGEAIELIDVHQALAEGRVRSYVEANRAWIETAAMHAGSLPEDFDRTRKMHLRSRRAYEDDGDRAGAANQLARAIGIDLSTGHIERARAGLDELRDEDMPAYARPFVELLRARADFLEGRSAAAQRRLERLRDRSGGEDAQETCQALTLLGDIDAARERADAAITHYREATACVDRVAERYATVTSEAHFRFSKQSTHARLASVLADGGLVDEAFLVIDRERALVLETKVRAVDIEQNETLWLEYATERAALEKLEAEGCSTMVRASSRSRCRRRLTSQRHAADAALTDFQAAIPKRPSVHRDKKWLARIRDVLGPKRAILMTIGHDASALHLLVTSKIARVTTTPDPIRAWWSTIVSLDHLYVIPDWHPKSFDPFNARTTDDQPLSAVLSMSFLPHANVLLYTPARSSGGAVVIADPDGTLPRARREGQWVAKYLGARTVTSTAIGAAGRANRAAVLDAWPQASTVHYTGHAVGRVGDPWSVALRLDEGQHLTSLDALHALGVPDLLVLNGCTTGPSHRAGGGGFPAAMVQAGARAVLATVAVQVDGSSTAFIKDFYEAGGVDTPADAFRRAVRSTASRGDPAWRLFRLWGPAQASSSTTSK